MSRMDEVVHRGYTIVRRDELYAWYGRQRLTHNVFKHLINTYHDVAKSKQRLSVLRDEGAYLLVDPSRLKSAEREFEIGED